MSNYRKFIIKGLVFLIMVVFFDFLLGLIMGKMEEMAMENNPSEMQADYTVKKVHSDVLIIGASDASHSYVPEILRDSLNLSVYNCGNDGKPSLYHIAVVNCILDRYSPKQIIWSVSPMWLSNKNANEDNNRLSVLNPFYHDYSYCKEVINKKSKWEVIKCKSNAYIYNSNIFNYLRCIFLPSKEYQYGRYKPLFGSKGSVELQKRDLQTTFTFSEELSEALFNTLKRCKDKGTKVVLVFTPRYEESDYQDLVSYKKIQEIALETDAILLEEYYRDSTIYKTKYFYDFAHLNDEGARIFTSLLANKLKNIY